MGVQWGLGLGRVHLQMVGQQEPQWKLRRSCRLTFPSHFDRMWASHVLCHCHPTKTLSAFRRTKLLQSYSSLGLCDECTGDGELERVARQEVGSMIRGVWGPQSKLSWMIGNACTEGFVGGGVQSNQIQS